MIISGSVFSADAVVAGVVTRESACECVCENAQGVIRSRTHSVSMNHCFPMKHLLIVLMRDWKQSLSGISSDTVIIAA